MKTTNRLLPLLLILALAFSLCVSVSAADTTPSLYLSYKDGVCYYCAYEGTAASTAVTQLGNNATVSDLNGGRVSNFTRLATGFTITITDAAGEDRFKVVIQGDIDGDGNVTQADYTMIKCCSKASRNLMR